MKKLIYLSLIINSIAFSNGIFENTEVKLKTSYELLHFTKINDIKEQKKENKIKLNYLDSSVNLKNIKLNAGLKVYTDEKSISKISMDTLHVNGFVSYESPKLSDGLYINLKTEAFMGPKTKEGFVDFYLGARYIFNENYEISSTYKYETNKVTKPLKISTNNIFKVNLDNFSNTLTVNGGAILTKHSIEINSEQKELKKYDFDIKNTGKYNISSIDAELGYTLGYNGNIDKAQIDKRGYIFDTNVLLGLRFDFNNVYKDIYIRNNIDYKINSYNLSFTDDITSLKVDNKDVSKDNKLTHYIDYTTTIGKKLDVSEMISVEPQAEFNYSYKSNEYNQIKLTEIVYMTITPINNLNINLKMTLPIAFQYDKDKSKFELAKVGLGGMVGVEYIF